jgi:2-C-methyl-D-erythritol 2,4-cyclodiphosphate synthase
MRIGHGYDVHRLVEGRELILGGTIIPYTKGLDGHSDADVLLHAVMDALLRRGCRISGSISGILHRPMPEFQASALRIWCETSWMQPAGA